MLQSQLPTVHATQHTQLATVLVTLAATHVVQLAQQATVHAAQAAMLATACASSGSSYDGYSYNGLNNGSNDYEDDLEGKVWRAKQAIRERQAGYEDISHSQRLAVSICLTAVLSCNCATACPHIQLLANIYS
jgi:hypothetical protein